MPEPGNLYCDFCTGENPEYAYPCKDLEFIAELSASKGEWCACKTCRDLVEAGDRQSLMRRAKDHLMHNPEFAGDEAFVIRAVEMLHGMFWANRIQVEKARVS